MVALGMSTVALSTNLFMLFVGLELASMASYVLISFNKETEIGPEAGVKYFIVGSVASAVGLYGLSMLTSGMAICQFPVCQALGLPDQMEWPSSVWR